MNTNRPSHTSLFTADPLSIYDMVPYAKPEAARDVYSRWIGASREGAGFVVCRLPRLLFGPDLLLLKKKKKKQKKAVDDAALAAFFMRQAADENRLWDAEEIKLKRSFPLLSVKDFAKQCWYHPPTRTLKATFGLKSHGYYYVTTVDVDAARDAGINENTAIRMIGFMFVSVLRNEAAGDRVATHNARSKAEIPKRKANEALRDSRDAARKAVNDSVNLSRRQHRPRLESMYNDIVNYAGSASSHLFSCIIESEMRVNGSSVSVPTLPAPTLPDNTDYNRDYYFRSPASRRRHTLALREPCAAPVLTIAAAPVPTTAGVPVPTTAFVPVPTTAVPVPTTATTPVPTTAGVPVPTTGVNFPTTVTVPVATTSVNFPAADAVPAPTTDVETDSVNAGSVDTDSANVDSSPVPAHPL